MTTEDQIAALEARINHLLPEPLHARISENEFATEALDIRVNLVISYRRLESKRVVDQGIDLAPNIARIIVHNIYSEMVAQEKELENWMYQEKERAFEN